MRKLFNFTKGKLMLLGLLLVCGIGAKAETATFNSGVGLPEGWSKVGDITNDDTRARSGWGLWTSSKSTTDNYVITSKVTGSFEFYARAYNKNTASEVIVYEYTGSGFGEQLYTTGSLRTSSTPSWSKFSFTVTGNKQLAIVLNYAAIDDVTYNPAAAAVDEPALTVVDGGIIKTSGFDYAFGLVDANATHEFTLQNNGNVDYNVAVSSSNANFTAVLSATAIAKDAEVTLTVTAKATGNAVITITPDAAGLDPFIINVSATIKDANKVFVNFADGLPEDWTQGSWTVSKTGGNNGGGYAANTSMGDARMFTKKLTFTENEPLIFMAANGYPYSGSTAGALTIQISTDGTTWSPVGDEISLTEKTWVSYTRNMPAGSYYVGFYGHYVYVTDIYGGEEPVEPNFKFSASDYNFGLITAAKTTEAYTIQNTGRGELTGLSVTSDNTNFTVAVADNATSIAAKSEVTFTVTMKADVKGAQSGKITVKADGFEAVEFNVSGYVADDSKLMITFDDNKAPEGWVNTGWSFANGVATGSYNSSTTSHNSEMTTPAIEVKAGETMAIEAKGNGSYAELKVYTSTDKGKTWTSVGDFSAEMRANTAANTVVVLSGIAAGTYNFKFEGYSVDVNTINGFSYDMNAPVLAVTPAEDAIFGKVTATPAAKTYTVTNSGTGKLTVNIASSTTDFTVTPAQIENIEAGESETFTVAFNYNVESLGEKSADITVTPTYNTEEAVSFKATATAKDPNVWEEDFEEGKIPAYWVSTGWTVSQPSSYVGGNGTYMAGPGNSNTAVLITPRLQATEGQVLKYYVYAESETYFVKAEYSTDEQATWNEIATYTTAGDQTFTAPADGNYYVRFTGYYTYLDNFEGFKLALPDHIAAITASSIPTSGLKQNVSFNAKVTVTESRGVEEALTAKLYMNDEEIGSATGIVAANGTKELTIVATPTVAADNAEMYIEVTYAGGVLKTDKVTRNVAAPTVLALNETSTDDIVAGTYDLVELTRSFTAGWNTIVLPFAVSDLSVFGDGAKAYDFTAYDNTGDAATLKFSKVTSMNMATPYLLYVPAAITAPVKFNDITVSSMALEDPNKRVDAGIFFIGTYQPKAAGSLTGYYGVTNAGKIAKATDQTTIKGFRGYIDLNNVSGRESGMTDPAPAKLTIVFDDETTGITTVMTAEQMGAEGIFNIGGQKVEKAQKGLYIVNGKKMVVK